MSPPLAPQPAIRLESVRLSFGKRLILNDINLTIPAGQVTAVMGPSGCGKTTILKLITGQLKPDSGRIMVGDLCVNELSGRALKAYRRNVGVLLQNGALFTDLTCFDNVALPLREHTDLPDTLLHHLVLLKLETVGLRGAADMYPRDLSGGMNRRIATARAMALDPAIMLYDEPFAGLDPISLGVALRLIREINQARGITSVVVTHDIDQVPKLAHHACLLADGNVVAEGPPEDLRNSDNALIRQFMRGGSDGPVSFHYPADSAAMEFLGRELTP
jgi:phospholipid/cholesterol/gamma-HCH transport system ATP-binding protein